jgi:hypothetical protein
VGSPNASSLLQGNEEWCGIILFFIFSIFDTLGRYAPGWVLLFKESTVPVRSGCFSQ